MASDRGLRTVSNIFTLLTVSALCIVVMVGGDWDAVRNGVATESSGDATDAALAGADGHTNAAGTTLNTNQSSICNDPRLVGVPIGPLTGRLSQDDPRLCGTPHAVRIDRVAGVALTPTAIMNCELAVALAHWMEKSAKPRALELLGAPLVRVRNVSDYVCRTRNHKSGAPLSAHAKANALDIAYFTLADGEQIAVKAHWKEAANQDRKSTFLKAVWRDACGPFRTVLGPESDIFHADHFHFDGVKRNNPYCK